MKAETIATSAAPKIKMYLPPPPLNFVDVKRPTSNKNSGHSNRIVPSMKETEDGEHVSPPSSPTNSYTDAYPSPSKSSPKLSLSFVSQAKRARNYTPPPRSSRRVVAHYRPPSPPTSDLPNIPSDADDVHVEVDHEGIQLRYAEVKRLLRKVFVFHIFLIYIYFECDILLIFAFFFFWCVVAQTREC